jgi:hypothetical protein
MIEWDPNVVVLFDRTLFLLRFDYVVLSRPAATIAVGEQEDEFTLVCRLKMWAVDKHVKMEG